MLRTLTQVLSVLAWVVSSWLQIHTVLLLTFCVASPVRNPTREAPELGGSVHEEAHPGISDSIETSLEGIDAGCINCSLIQLILPVKSFILLRLTYTVGAITVTVIKHV